MIQYLILFFLLLFSYTGFSQNKVEAKVKNSALLSVGTSASIFSKLSFTDSTNYIFRNQTLPAINIGYDLASKSNVTFGATILIENFQFYKLDSNGTIFLNRQKKLTTRGSFSKKDVSFIRINPGLKILYHYLSHSSDIYGGFRFGYETFTSVPKSFKFYNKLSSKTSIQFLVGYRMFVKSWAFNTEFAVGKPYWFYAGVSYKIYE